MHPAQLYLHRKHFFCSQILGHRQGNNDEASLDEDSETSEQLWTLVSVIEAPSFQICFSDIDVFKRNLTLFPFSKIY